ncbi:MAG: hypothetical protein K9N23_10845 [Akkermansiaceae bacterium]|nr:hypothetical protein [Akkermansiaceae bacterium]MCF7732178.1 hypothetical protein [Akkermansiaceae bacterium]
MKRQQLLPPLAAVIAGGVWLGYLAAARQSLAAGNAGLRERIAAARAAAENGPGPSLAEPQARGGRQPATGKLTHTALGEWRELADAMLAADGGGMADLRLNLRTRNRLEKMSAAEVLATFDELAASDISPEGLAKLQGLFFDVAAEKDPQLTLRHFESLLAEGDDSPLRGNLGRTFGRWAGNDLAGAIAWFDEMNAAGKFDSKRLDGRNPLLAACAGQVIAGLLRSDPEASLVRLEALPESQRLEALDRGFSTLKPGTEEAFARLVREGLPEDQRSNAFSEITRRLASNQGMAKAGEFFDAIDATPAEREALAGTAASRGMGELLRRQGSADELYDWLARQAPQAADRNAGQALAENVSSAGFEQMASMAAELHERTGNDELLAAFLTPNVTAAEPAAAIAMAARIKDDALREKIQAQIEPPPAGTSP